MANFTEAQKQRAIQSIEQFFRDRGNELINPIVLDDDGNEIAGAENIFEALSNGGRVRIPGAENEVPDILRMNNNGRVYAIDAAQQAEMVRRIGESYQRYGLEGEPAGIDEQGNPVTGADKIAEALTQGKEIRFADTEQPGSYHTMQINGEGGVDLGWRASQNFAQVVPEGQENINAPQKPEYMTRPDEEEVLEQKEAVMIPADLRSHILYKYAKNGKVQGLDWSRDPLESTDAVLEELSKGDAVFLQEGEEGKYRMLVYPDGDLHVSSELFAEPKLVDIDQTDRVDLEKSAFLHNNRIEEAEDAQGNVYKGHDEILAKLNEPDAKLFLYDDKRVNVIAAQNRDGDLHTAGKAMPDLFHPDYYVHHQGFLPDQGDNILGFKKDDIDYAVDKDGRRYETPEALTVALYGTDKTLSVYLKGKEQPYEVTKKNNRFYTKKHLDEIEVRSVEKTGVEKAKEFLTSHWTLPGEGENKDVYFPEEAKQFGNEFALAVDADGNVYRDMDSAAEFLASKDGNRLFVFDKAGNLPYAVQYKDGSMLISNDYISSQNRLRESDEYQPKKSLDVDDIIKRADYSKVSVAKDDVSDWQKMKKFYEKNIHAIEFVKSQGKPNKPKEPKKPSLGFWNTLAYWGKLIITFGQGDTKAHREYLEELEAFPHLQAGYPKRLAEFEEKDKKWKEYEANGEAKLAEYREGLEKAKQKLDGASAKLNDARDVFNDQLKDNDVMDVNTYRDKLEVKLEGVADLQKQGKITRQNIFANTWMKETACDGKKASDPEAKKALLEYVASRTVEEQILGDRVSGRLVNANVEDRRVGELNNGKAYAALEKDPDVNEMLDNMGDDKINPGMFYNDLTKKLATRSYEKKGYKAVYEENVKSMVDLFGKKKVDESCLDDLIRLNRLQKYQKRDEGYALPYDEKTANAQHKIARDNIRQIYRDPITEQDRDLFRPAVQALKDENKGPMKLDDMLTAVHEKRHQLQEQAEAQEAQAGGPQPQA
ncbi:MAG: hypothetical protein IKW92_09200 [Firmicutes bacterium]|nr:hypothetical protein [Bacillota bacterium]